MEQTPKPQYSLSEDGLQLLDAQGEVVGVKQEDAIDGELHFAKPGMQTSAAKSKKKIRICAKWDKKFEVCLTYQWAYVDDDSALA